jgi:hypothetical protein
MLPSMSHSKYEPALQIASVGKKKKLKLPIIVHFTLSSSPWFIFIS